MSVITNHPHSSGSGEPPISSPGWSRARTMDSPTSSWDVCRKRLGDPTLCDGCIVVPAAPIQVHFAISKSRYSFWGTRFLDKLVPKLAAWERTGTRNWDQPSIGFEFFLPSGRADCTTACTVRPCTNQLYPQPLMVIGCLSLIVSPSVVTLSAILAMCFCH